MKNDLLDNIIKEKLSEQQYEFTAADWDSFDKKQNGSSGNGPTNSNWKWYLGGAAAIVTIAIASALWLSEDNSNSSSNQLEEPTISQNNLEDKSNEETDHNPVINNNTNPENTSDDNTNEEITDDNSVIEHNATNNTEDHSETSPNEMNDAPVNDTETENTENNIDITGDKEDNTTKPDSKEIAIPSAVIMSGNLEICANESISLETLEQTDVTYSWNLGDGNYSTSRTISHKYTKPGKYLVSLIVTSSKDHSILSKSKDVVIEVNALPNTNFEIEYLTDAIIPSVKVYSEIDLPTYHWEFEGGTSSSDASPEKSFKRKGYYNISLTSQDHNGCQSKTTKKAIIKDDYNLLAPNSFTPNGDGINDYFIPEALKTMDAQFTMTIYSKNQGLIFETKNINQQWDGSNQQNGENCIEGTYIWVVSLINPNGQSEQYKGAVLLLK